eukprot:759342-Hanusia_phi.AAC.2
MTAKRRASSREDPSSDVWEEHADAADTIVRVDSCPLELISWGQEKWVEEYLAATGIERS